MQGKPAVPRACKPLADRYWDKVVFGMECWAWSGGTTVWGYGMLSVGRRGEGFIMAHRLSWELHYGPIPPGGVVRHSCDNPACSNPAHLDLGTFTDNAQDAISRGRFKHLTPAARERGKIGRAQYLARRAAWERFV